MDTKKLVNDIRNIISDCWHNPHWHWDIIGLVVALVLLGLYLK